MFQRYIFSKDDGSKEKLAGIIIKVQSDVES